MIETRQELLKGKSTVIKNVQFLSTASYVQPFFDRLDKLKATYIINVKVADQMSTTNKTPDIIYNKVHIQAVLPDTYYKTKNTKKVVGFVYGLDVKKPAAKFYIADIDDQGNLYVFDINKICYQVLEDSTPINYSPIDTLLQSIDANPKILEQMINTEYADRNDMHHKMGEWIKFSMDNYYVNDLGKIKLASSMAIDAYKNLCVDKDSATYIPDTKPILMQDAFKTFADLIRTDKDIFNNFEKTYLVSQMIHNTI